MKGEISKTNYVICSPFFHLPHFIFSQNISEDSHESIRFEAVYKATNLAHIINWMDVKVQ